MPITLFLMLVFAQAGADWRPLPTAGGEGYHWRLAADDAGEGPVRRAVLRSPMIPTRHRFSMQLSPQLATVEMTAELACANQTLTVLEVRAFDAVGIERRSVIVPEDRRRADQIHEDAAASSALYTELCTGAAPLSARPDGGR